MPQYSALYFKAKWSGNSEVPMFNSELTEKSQPFYLDGGGESKVDYMVASRYFRYGKVGTNGIVELPYADGKFAMYIILPDIKGGNGLSQLLSSLTSEKLSAAISSMTTEAMVNLHLPKFELENKYELTDMLNALGIRRAFNNDAQFDKLLYHPDIKNFKIGSVIQKARISVAEWGTEAGAATAVMIERTAPGQTKMVKFLQIIHLFTP